jgi:tRNA U34 2-thiouridine synthase MnmA/TrmU
VSPRWRREVCEGNSPKEREVIVQVRSRHRGVRATVQVLAPDRCLVSWNDDWAAVSPGQAAVMYDLNNEELLAGGRICSPK